MDISALSITLNQSQLHQQANLSVMKMAMNTAQQNSTSITKMLEQSFAPHLGSQIDVKL